MLTEGQKLKLENHIYDLLKESLFERLFGEEKSEDEKEKKEDKPKKKKNNETSKKRQEVMQWLEASESEDTASYSINHADLVRKLWNPESEEEEDELRSLFSKKLHHKLNDNGSPYDFNDEEINTLYNIKGNIV